MNDFFRGMRLALPIVLGYAPVGFAFGVLGMQAGMTPATVALMSLVVYAGSSQLIAAGLLTAGAGTAGIVLAAFVVNLRHLLMSAALTPYLRRWTRLQQALFSFELTDETFAANLGRFSARGVNKGETFGLNVCAHVCWVAAGLGGALFDSAIGDLKPLGLDFALPAMFIALLLPHFAVPARLSAACAGAAFSLCFFLAGTGQWSVILATLCAATPAAFLPWPGGRGKKTTPSSLPADKERGLPKSAGTGKTAHE
jgi:4-azaleucine resistance transporter AzlC